MSAGRSRERALRALGFALAVAVLALVGATLWLSRGLAGRPGVLGDPLPLGDLMVDAGIVAAGLLLTTARPRSRIGWLLLLFALLGAAQNGASVYGVRATAVPQAGLPLGPLALSLGSSLWVPAIYLLVPVLVLLYPDGHLPSPRWRWVCAAGGVGTGLLTVATATAPSMTADGVRGGRPVLALPAPVTGTLAVVGIVLLLGSASAAVVGTVVRTARARGAERQQLLWLLVAAAVVLVLALSSPPAWLFSAGLALVPVAVAIGVLRYRLMGIELLVRGTLLYGVLTGIVLAVFVGVTAGLSSVLPSGHLPGVVAAGMVAGVLVPARNRLQRGVDRLVRGPGADPLAVVQRVGDEVSAPAADPLPALLSAVAQATRARYAAVVEPSGEVLAATGSDGGPHTSRPLIVRGEHLGDLVVATGAWDKRNAGLLDALAGPLGVVVHARRLDADLAAAHERLLRATLDERARIRRDLHDGLGPSLSGVVLGLDAVAARLPDGASTGEIVRRLRQEAERAVEEVRRIIDALRPVALDGGGLLDAVRARAAAVAHRLPVEVDAPDPMPALPAPIETAAYRIADEAVTNVVRHADATRCVVRMRTGAGELVLEVCDDGRGLPAVPRPEGLGLASMRRRAEEVGGSLVLRSGERGTSLVARLPMARP